MVLLVLTVIIGGVGCNKKNTKSNENEVIIGYDNTYFPMGYLDEDGKYSRI